MGPPLAKLSSLILDHLEGCADLDSRSQLAEYDIEQNISAFRRAGVVDIRKWARNVLRGGRNFASGAP